MTAAGPQNVEGTPLPGSGPQPTEDDLAIAVVLGVHRLTKGATLYDAENQAAIRQLEMTRRAVIAYGKLTGVNPKLFFTDKSVFVGGRLLRAGRNVYGVALELGRILRRFSIDEVAIGYDVPVEDLRLLQSAMREALGGKGESPAKKPYKRIRMRRGQPPGRKNENLTPEEVIIRTYATATIVMRRFLEQIQSQEYKMPIGVRRVAQQLAELGAVQNPAFLGTTAIYNSKHEHAGRAVNSALLALAMARQLTDDKRLLARVASGALLFDIGIPRVAGTGPLGEGRVGAALPNLIEEQVPELPPSTAATAWAVGGFGNAAIQHTVLTYEATAIAHPEHAPAPYNGLRAPTIHARIVATARRFTKLLADPDHEWTPDQVLSKMIREAQSEADRTMIRLLMSALGFFTSGCLVRLSTGETAQVVRTSDNPLMFSTPVVKPVLAASGASLRGAQYIDLVREQGPGGVVITELVQLGDDSSVQEAPAPAVAPAPVPSSSPDASGAYDLSGYDVDGRFADHPPSEPSGQDDAFEIEDEATHDLQGIPAGALPDDGATRSFDAGYRPDFQAAIANANRARLASSPSISSGPPSGPGGSWTTSTAPDDEDDVPSMVLQAIVDGRQPGAEPEEEEGEGAATAYYEPERKNELASLFFGREGGPGRERERRTRPRPNRPGADSIPKARPSSAPAPPSGRGPMAMPPERHGGAIALGARPPAGSSSAPPAQSSPHGPPASQPAASQPGLRPRSESHSSLPRRRKATRDWLRDKLTGVRPTSQGNLQKTPLVHLLVYMLDRGLTGTTMLVAEGMKTHFIYFDQGTPSKVRTTGGVSPLDRVILELGLAEESALLDALTTISRTGELMGKHLVDSGVLDATSVRAALQWQVVRKIEFMLDLPPTTRFAYYDRLHMLDDYGGPELTPVEPLMLIMSGIRRMSGTPALRRTIARLGNNPLRLPRSATVNKLGLRPEERGVMDLLRARPMTLGELFGREIAPQSVIEHTVYAFIITRNLKLGDKQKPPVGHGRPSVELLQAQLGARESGAGVPPSGAGAGPSSQGNDVRRPRRSTHQGDVAAMPRRGSSSTRGGGMFSGGTPAPTGGLPRRGTASSARLGTDSGLPRRGTRSTDGAPPGQSPRASRPGPERVSAPGPQPAAPVPAAHRPSAPGPPAPAAPARPRTPSRPSAAAPQPSRPSAPGAPPARRSRPQARRAQPSPPSRQSHPTPDNTMGHAAELSTEERDLIDEVIAKSKRLDEQNLFEVLGIDESATAPEVQKAYLALAKKWHPDRLPKSLDDHKAKVAKVFAKVNEAYQTLSDEQKRQEYVDLVKHGGGTSRDRELIERAMDAGLVFQKGEVMFKKGEYAQAEALVHQAMQADPENLEYRAMLAWIQAHVVGAPPDDHSRKAHYKRQIALLNEVIASDKNFAKALYYRGELLKRSGDEDRAYKDFRKVMSLDPRNIDAAREVRLYEVRAKKKQGGLFGRLFKK